MSLSVFPREPAASLDTTVDYVKVGTTNVHAHLHITGKAIQALGSTVIGEIANKTWIMVVLKHKGNKGIVQDIFCAGKFVCLSSYDHTYISCTHL